MTPLTNLVKNFCAQPDSLSPRPHFFMFPLPVILEPLFKIVLFILAVHCGLDLVSYPDPPPARKVKSEEGLGDSLTCTHSGGFYGTQLYIRLINHRAYLKVLLWPRGFYSAMATGVLCRCSGNCILDSRERRSCQAKRE